MPGSANLYNTYLPPDLARRFGVGSGADLRQHLELLALCDPSDRLSAGEQLAVMDALNGVIVEPHTAHLLWATVDDACRSGLAEKWGSDGAELVDKLRNLHRAEAWVLACVLQARLARGETK